MLFRYSQHNPLPANQTLTADGKEVFKLDKWKRFDRFLVLGSEGGSYYVSEKKLTEQNISSLEECIKEDWQRTLQAIVNISEEGRAIKNDPALYALAKLGVDTRQEVRQAAYAQLPKVARIGTHLFHFVEFIANDKRPLRGWGRSLRTAVSNWYNNKNVDQLTYQVTKYQSRDGWSHRDLLRLAHVKPRTPEHSIIFKWLTNRDEVVEFPEKLRKLEVATQLLTATSVDTVLGLLKEGEAVRELIPTQFLNDVRVWEGLLPSMPVQALVRNLGKLASLDVTKPLSKNEKLVINKLTSEEDIKKSRIHPMQVLTAVQIYKQGHGDKGKLSWKPNSSVQAALEDLFYKSFKNIEPTGKNIYVGLDISGSMGSPMAGSMSGISCAIAGMAMAMTFVRTEPNTYVRGFASAEGEQHWSLSTMMRDGTAMRDLKVNKNTSLDTVVKNTFGLTFGATDCSAAFEDALKQGLDVDCFVIITDSETNSNRQPPVQALKEYRRKSGKPNAKLVVIGMVANEISIADPTDQNMLDVVGMDTSVPQVVADFIKNGYYTGLCEPV